MFKNILNIILNINKKYHGVPSEYSTDGFVKWEEVNIATGVTFPEKTPIGFTPRNQSWSGSCVDQTIAKIS